MTFEVLWPDEKDAATTPMRCKALSRGSREPKAEKSLAAPELVYYQGPSRPSRWSKLHRFTPPRVASHESIGAPSAVVDNDGAFAYASSLLPPVPGDSASRRRYSERRSMPSTRAACDLLPLTAASTRRT